MKRKINWWKVATLSIITFIILGLGIAFIELHQSNSDIQKNIPNSTEQVTKITEIKVNNKQVNALANFYLNKSSMYDKYHYHFVVHKQLILYGNVKFLGQNLNYGLMMNPAVTRTGNIKLHAEKIALGRLKLPIDIIMLFAKHHYNLPKGVSISGHNLYINPTKLVSKSGLIIQAKQFNVKKGIYLFKISIPKK